MSRFKFCLMNKRMLFKNYTKKPRKYLSTEAEAGDSANGLGIYRRLPENGYFLQGQVEDPAIDGYPSI